MNRLFTAIIGSLFLFGCADYGKVHDRMTLAESQMLSSPDSALATIMSVNRRHLRTPKDKARYALIYSQALDKNYIDVANDSLSRTAADFYNEYGPARKRILANFYHGRVLRNSGEYIKAMLSFLDAEQDIESTGDNYIAGLTYTQMGDIYKHYCDYAKSFEAYDKSREHYEKAGLIQHRNYALLYMGTTYLNTHNPELSITTLKHTLEEANKASDSVLMKLCLCELMIVYDSNGKYRQAFNTINDLRINFNNYLYNTDIIGCIAHIYAANKFQHKATQYLNYGWSLAHNSSDSSTMYYHSARINVQINNYKQAYIDYNKSTALQLELLQESLRQPIISAQRDYFHRRAERNRQRYTISRIITTTIAGLCVTAILAIVKYMRYRIRLKNEEINKYMATVHELRCTIRQNDNNMAPLLERLLKDRLQLIDELGNMYYEQSNTSKQQECIYRKVRNVIDDLSNNKKTLAELEDIVNKCRNNKMARLRAEMPELKEKDFKLACYVLAGFSNRVICVFTGDTIENVYKRKSRLKAKIAAANTPGKDSFLSAL